MYHLVIAGIAVIVGAALSLAIWIGGPVYTTAKARADLLAIEGQSAQIAAALTLYQQEHVSGPVPSSIAGLRDTGYLKDIPSGSWTILSTTSMYRPITQQTPEACSTMNELAGYPATCPACDSNASASYPACQISE